MFRSISITLAAAILCCSTAEAQRHTERGALLGGLTGAMLGAAIGDNNGEGAEGALIGGAIGLFSGAALGNSVDREQALWHGRYQQQQAVRHAEAVSMADVVQMTQSGLSEHIIMNQIRQRGVQRRIQVSDVIYLHRQGVSEGVITTMQQASLGTSQVVRPAPAPRPPVVVERHHFVSPHPYWHPYHRPPFPHYYRRYHHQPGVRFGISIGN